MLLMKSNKYYASFQCLVKEKVFIVFLNEGVKKLRKIKRLCQCFAIETFFSFKKESVVKSIPEMGILIMIYMLS